MRELISPTPCLAWPRTENSQGVEVFYLSILSIFPLCFSFCSQVALPIRFWHPSLLVGDAYALDISLMRSSHSSHHPISFMEQPVSPAFFLQRRQMQPPQKPSVSSTSIMPQFSQQPLQSSALQFVQLIHLTSLAMMSPVRTTTMMKHPNPKPKRKWNMIFLCLSNDRGSIPHNGVIDHLAEADT